MWQDTGSPWKQFPLANNTAPMLLRLQGENIWKRRHTSILIPGNTTLPSLPSLVSPLHLFTHSTLYWTALSRNGDTIWNMSISNTSNTRPLSIPGTRNINNLTLETLGKSLYWINSMNATIERYDLQTGQLRTIAEDAANVTGTVVESLDRWPISGCLHMSFDLYYWYLMNLIGPLQVTKCISDCPVLFNEDSSLRVQKLLGLHCKDVCVCMSVCWLACGQIP